MKKIVYMKSIFENGWWEDAQANPSSYPTASAPGHKLPKLLRESGRPIYACGHMMYYIRYSQ